MVRAGKNGEQENICLQNGIITIGWDDLPDLRSFKARTLLNKEYVRVYKEKSPYSVGSKVGQIWRFANEIKKGDLVALPSKFSPEIHLGIVSGKYIYDQNGKNGIYHSIPVEWKKSVPRSSFEEDLLYSFGSLLTVSRISRNEALQRVKAKVEGREIPKLEKVTEESDESIENAQTEELAYTKIELYIQNNFKDYELEDLIREILKAHGYTTSRTREIAKKSKKGADGGVDILASQGALGFEEPRLCVQVKSGQEKLPPKELRELIGVMATFKAEFGLLVSWSGFSDELIRESREKYFNIRLWSSDDIIRELFEHYNKFSQEFKIKVPLKKIWILEES